MFMDGRVNADYGLLNLKAMKCNESASILSDQNFLNAINLNDSFIDLNSMHRPTRLLDSGPSKRSSPSALKDEGDLHEDSDFSDLVLKYINQMLMEEDIEEKSCMLQESAALHAAEKSFYDALMVKERPSNASHLTVPFNSTKSKDAVAESLTCFGGNSSIGGTDFRFDVSGSSLLPSALINFDSQSRFQPSYSSLSSTSSVVDVFVDSPVSTLSFPDMFCDGRSTVQFQKGLGDASRFLPSDDGILDYMDTGVLLGKDQKDDSYAVVVKVEKEHKISSIPDGSRGKKIRHSKDLLEDGRSSKQSAVYIEPHVRSKMFDEVLLCDEGKTNSAQCEFVRNGVTNVQQKGQPKGSNGVKARGKNQGGKKDAVDLRILLSLCAQSVAANDQRGVTDLLKRIREHASPTGDGMQRLAHYFCAGLEARMAGSGTVIYKALLSRPTSAVDVLKAYHLFLGIFPFTKLSHFVSNKTIMRAAQNKKRLHIIDFGILYGFQWPCLIQRLSTRPGGPPELRITGIDFPCPGFRPSQRVEETGCRLANYAETFGVPFKFKAIAQKWETIKMADLELDNNETLVVNCAYRFRNLLDETVMVHSPRNEVLDLIRKMNPEIFIQGVVNGSYNSPFFVTRFREALFFFSSLFDLLEATVASDTQERMLIEKTLWGREAMNVIACEGGERIERPETYKQWQVRNQRAGFRQIPFDEEILKMAKDRARSGYHKDFMIDEDGHWTLQGWKGRILYAISSWKPAY
ncbi:scarecrow-like protein 14 isoform X1 [Cynara cardunculus var. scolymus]|uniref:Transcription factor GRAS n=1 Tax=Cynara cardunculus var. scolymus TaxID=59895 RepID=A0A103Y9C7_CYNCS|nr:scarecrow-like protein 14 isoform X1 [Cynara cardunculus var. scolymus]KVI04910.1 Transcription factor GRAS [Cynara cardunculus var. scolymus]